MFMLYRHLILPDMDAKHTLKCDKDNMDAQHTLKCDKDNMDAQHTLKCDKDKSLMG